LHFIFNHQETPVCQLLDGRGFVQACQGQKGGSGAGYTFKQSAHSPLFEEPEKTCKIMREDVLTGSKGLADPE
jgi:hypothetical protein